MVLLVLFLALPTYAGDLLNIPWKAAPATGVQMTLTQTDVIRIDFDFQGRAGYAIARRDGKLDLPDNFELAFRIRGDAPPNTLEVKFVSGENVWWTTRREYVFPLDWRRVSIKKRQLEFAWGPAGPGPLPKIVDSIEIVVTAGKGGKGTVWLDDVVLLPLETAAGSPPANTFPATGTVDLGARFEIGGVVVDRADRVETSIDGRQWEERVAGGAAWIPLPDTDARYIRATGAKSLRVLPPMRDDNEFFSAVARESRRGLFPRYLLGEQSYWTILGGTNGEEQEALFSEDGAIEAGHARFSIEPFLLLDGKLVSWSDVEVEQREGPQVVWKKHLTITPRYENGSVKVRYEVAPNAQLLLAIRPFQVNPQWQFLNRTGGVVRVREITSSGNEVTVDADARMSLRVDPFSSRREDLLPEARVAGDYKSTVLTFDAKDVTIEIPFEAPANRQPPTANRPTPTANRFQLSLPAEPRLAKTIEAQLNFILINQDGPAIHPGSRSYERAWIRDGSLTSEALLRLGQDEVVREFIEWYAKSIREDGYVPCCVSTAGADPVPEHDSHGQFIYLIAEYYRHTGDRALVERMMPLVRRVVGFIDKLRHERMTKQYESTAFFGLVPESISHEGYSAKAMHSYWDDLFILKGLEDAAFLENVVAGGPGRRVVESSSRRDQGEAHKPHPLEDSKTRRLEDSPDSQPSPAQMAAEFRQHLLASIARTMRDHKIDYVPGSVELGDFDATSTTVGVTPVDAELPRQPLLRTFEKYWTTALQPRTYTPYELRVVGTLVRLGQAARARTLLSYFFEDQRPAAWHQWAEVVRANPREGGFIGDMPHTWVGSDFIRSALDFLAYEDDDALIVGAGISREWAERGLSVRGLSTHFGTLDYTIDARKIRIRGDLRVPKNGIVVKSPYGSPDIIVRTLPAEVALTP